MGEEPRDVEARIDDTRERMGETVDALTAKADVPGRVKGYAGQKKDAVASTLSDAAGGVAAAGSGATDDAKARARRGAAFAQENPIGLAVGSVAVGFLVGMLMPGSSIENDRIGPKADQLKDEVREVAGETLQQTKDAAGEVARDAVERVRA
jgi:ElaB/YqjD/DUF883 family membrane-anchored ribosome-binding protein